MATIEEFLKQWFDNKPYIEAFTSGSTGQPKKIELLKSDMSASACATNAFFGINKNSVLGLPLSVDYIAGKMMIVRAIEADCRLIELPVSNEIKITEKIDLLSIVPSQLSALLEDEQSLVNIRNLLIGGAPLSYEQEVQLIKALKSYNFKAWMSYGMTETCSHVALREIGKTDYYIGLPGITFSTDDRGCLIINNENFSNSQIKTNDVVDLLSSNSFKWLGRADNVIISGALKIHPEQLEAEYRKAFPSLNPFYLTWQNDSKLGQSLVMVVEGEPEDDILLKLKNGGIYKYHLPRKIIFLKKLPYTDNGKLKRLEPGFLTEFTDFA